MISIIDVDREGKIEKAISRLVSSRVEGGRARIAMPVLYPSGAGAAVEVTINGDSCFVSDIALGFTEAEMYGASGFYDSAAKKASERFGVGFDGFSVFAVRSSLDRIEGAIVAVANASVNATAGAIFRAVEEKEKKVNVELFERLTRVFGPKSITRQREIKGREVLWSAHNVVSVGAEKLAIFEYVNDNSISVSSRFIMFSDLARAGGIASLNSVVSDLGRIGPKARMLADVSNVMPFSATDAEYIAYAKAA